MHTLEETGTGGQIRMHQFVIDGHTHEIGLVSLLVSSGFLKRTARASARDISRPIIERGCAGSACAIKEHIDRLFNEGREQLICETPRSSLVDEDSISQSANTGGIEVIVAKHFQSWTGDLNAFNDDP